MTHFVVGLLVGIVGTLLIISIFGLYLSRNDLDSY